MSNKIKQYRALRQISINQINDLKDFAEQASKDKALQIQFKMMFKEFKNIQGDFKSNHSNIITLLATQDDADLANEDTLRKEFDFNCSCILAIHYSLFEENVQVDSNVASALPSAFKPNIKLPKIEIPKFAGVITKFRSFIDMYKSLVHEDSALSDIEKFHYLISFLQGPPLALVQCIPMVAENYQSAFESLLNRYDKPRMIAFAHLQGLDNAPILTNSNKDLKTLRLLLDMFSENIAALKCMGFPTDDWDFLLFYMFSKHLNDNILTKFEVELNSQRSTIPTFDQLKTFVLKQCNALEAVEFSANLRPQNNSDRIKSNLNYGPNKFNKRSASFFGKVNSVNCLICKSEHAIYKCLEFTKKSPQERFNIAKSNNLCTNCLSAQHTYKSCNSTSRCRTCNSKHHTLLHLKRDSAPAFEKNFHIQDDNSIPTTSAECHSSINISDRRVSPIEVNNSTLEPTRSTHDNFSGIASSFSRVLLSTAIVEVLDAHGVIQAVRILVDCGSQTNYITQKCLNRLQLPRFDMSLTIQGLNEMQEFTTHGGVTCAVKPLGKSQPVITIDAFILPKICPDMPSHFIENRFWPHISKLQLADPNFFQPGPIDMLLGADAFPYILKDGRVSGKPDEPVAVNTIFGWMLMGKFICETPLKRCTSSLFSVSHDNDLFSLDKTFKKFWELEEIPKQIIMSSDDQLCENHFNSTHSRDETGRYVIELPFRCSSEPNFDSLSSYLIARRRFYSLEKRLILDKNLYHAYSSSIQDYLEQGYLEIVSDDDKNDNCYYIPHHCVLKPEKIRIVYNASTRTNQGISLNDMLLTGPKLQRNITTLLLKFRLYKVVFTCDIKSMFLQIRVATKHQNFQRILWRFTPSEPLRAYKFSRVIFGLACSPFLANRTIMQLAHEERSSFPLASRVLENDIYVDDIVTGSNSLEQAKVIQQELIKLLRKGGFELHKWCSNSWDFLYDLPITQVQSEAVDFDLDADSIKILGLHWHAQTDSFLYHCTLSDSKCSKRNILSEIARIYDPIGFLTPITIYVKCLMQNLWTLGLDWDEIPPSNVCVRWTQFKQELSLLSSLKIPRLIPVDNSLDCQLHGFCDASLKAYACVIYLRIRKSENIQTYFVTAKSKVAPLKQISLPRLELSAAVLLANLIAYVLEVFDNKFQCTEIYAWSDSTISLSWIKSPAQRWKTFISNRVSCIQDKVPPNCWHHISSKNNPSDCASRGLMPSELLGSSIWWTGPSWLKLPKNNWPSSSFEIQHSSEVTSEQRKCSFATFTKENIFDQLINKFSSFSKIQRIWCYINRFIENSKQPQNKRLGILTLTEFNLATLRLIKHVQNEHFSAEINSLRNGKVVSRLFRKLNVFLDEQGILRVGGRLVNAQLPYTHKHPALLPRKNRLTSLIIEYFHKIYLHPGAQTLQYLLSQFFWILAAKRTIRTVLSKCLQCYRLKPRPFQPFMGNLPKFRISQIKAFSVVGVDYAGPFNTRLGRIRGAKTFKSYICVFVCFATKAIHLELASDLSSEAFLCAFRRFIARRGRCSKLYSDCGTNFVGANKYIRHLMQCAAETESIDWHFNPPSAPHFSGLVEAGVKSVKTHLQRVIGDQILTFEEFYTVIVQIESLLNSRPLCPMSSDPNDLSALTPGHFLTLEPISALPDSDLSHLKSNQLSRWQLLQKLQQHFWYRWRHEYLHTLQQRHKWLDPLSPSPNVGTLVLIKNDISPPSKWPLGRITELHPGKDGISRIATVRTQDGNYKRPLVKLCPLPELT